jgi:PE-PPE domain
MKKAIFGAALCGATMLWSAAAVFGTGAANADSSTDWLASLTAWIDTFFAGSSGDSAASSGANADFLASSTHALILGPTGVPTPDAAYIADAEKLYLDPNGYDGTNATTLALTTPETNDYSTSVAQGETDLVNAVQADYNAGDMVCHASGVCSDPLTIFTYSQSSAIADLAEKTLASDGIPTDALRFVDLGDDPLGVPDNLYPTEVYNITGDTWALPGSGGTSLQDLEVGLLLHETYLGLTSAEIDSASTTVDGLTTFYTIPELTLTQTIEAIMSAIAAQ